MCVCQVILLLLYLKYVPARKSNTGHLRNSAMNFQTIFFCLNLSREALNKQKFALHSLQHHFLQKGCVHRLYL